MRTVVTYLDKGKKSTAKENAWTVMTQIFNDAGNLQRTGYSVGEAQAKAISSAEDKNVLSLKDETDGKSYNFTKTVVRLGRESACDVVFDQKEDKKKIDKVHAVFELRQGVWHVMDMSKSGVWVNGQKIAGGVPTAVRAGDSVELGQRRKLKIG